MHEVGNSAAEKLAAIVVYAGLQVHKTIGPGLLESAYEHCLFQGLQARGAGVERQVQLPIDYRDARLEAAYRLDLVVGNAIIIEVEAVERLLPIHEAQLVTYLRLSRFRIGFLMNFHVPLFRQGLNRMVI